MNTVDFFLLLIRVLDFKQCIGEAKNVERHYRKFGKRATTTTTTKIQD